MVLSQTDILLTLDIINRCLKARTHEDIAQIFQLLSTQIGIVGGLIGRVDSLASSDLHGSSMISFGVPQEWTRLYKKNKFIDVDPVVKFAFQHEEPVRWVDAYQDADSNQQRFIDIARDFNLADGLSNGVIADRKNGVATIVSTIFADTNPSTQQLAALQILLPHLNEAIAYSGIWDLELPRLTERELEALKWAKVGKSYWETGRIMNISERTVRFHLSNVYKKLNVINRTQAVARAVKVGYIDL